MQCGSVSNVPAMAPVFALLSMFGLLSWPMDRRRGRMALNLSVRTLAVVTPARCQGSCDRYGNHEPNDDFHDEFDCQVDLYGHSTAPLRSSATRWPASSYLPPSDARCSAQNQPGVKPSWRRKKAFPCVCVAAGHGKSCAPSFRARRISQLGNTGSAQRLGPSLRMLYPSAC